MKKTYFVFLVMFLVSMPVYAMKVVYQNDTGKIMAIGPFVNYLPADGQSIKEVPAAKPEQIKTHIMAGETYREKNAQEKSADLAAVASEKTDRKNRKKSVLTKIGIDKNDIKGLLELIQDGNDE